MLTRTLKVHAIRSETPTTAALDLIEQPVEGQPVMGRTMSIPGLTPAQAAEYQVNQDVTFTIAPKR
ncbi:MAG: hypothetical protein C0503_02860 [Gemmatimonas sp.]|nr:hypothetical protein [Gemmatimonas sp.]